MPIGDAVRLAKQRYFNSLGPNALSNYDEKVLAIWTLYGLPMRRVRVPAVVNARPEVGAEAVSNVAGDDSGTQASADKRGESSSSASIRVYPRPNDDSGLAATIAVNHTITPVFTAVNTTKGRFYTVAGETQALAGRPVEPRLSLDIAGVAGIAHGALLVGGRTRDERIDPLVTRVITDNTDLAAEPLFDSSTFYPGRIVAVNRLLRVEGDVLERLVVTPGQFRATADTPQTVGIQRVWERLEVVTYHAPFSTTDFTAPNIWRTAAAQAGDAVRFTVETTDAGGVSRAVILYHLAGSPEWRLLELALSDPAAGAWTGLLPGAGRARVEFYAQAVDAAGNVAWRDDYGSPFAFGRQATFLPVIVR